MLLTRAKPGHDTDRVFLYTHPAAARGDQGEGSSIYWVAVRSDAPSRRLVPLWVDPLGFDPAWTTRASDHGDGSIIARGSIPDPLFVVRSTNVSGRWSTVSRDVMRRE